jgi:hypothetical protein
VLPTVKLLLNNGSSATPKLGEGERVGLQIEKPLIVGSLVQLEIKGEAHKLVVAGGTLALHEIERLKRDDNWAIILFTSISNSI